MATTGEKLLKLLERLEPGNVEGLVEGDDATDLMALCAAIAQNNGYEGLTERAYSTGLYLGLMLGIGYAGEYGVPDISKKQYIILFRP